MLWFLFACASPEKEEAPKAENVLLLMLDGVRVQEISTSDEISDNTGVAGEKWAPNIWKTLAANGTVVRSIYNVGVTLTSPSHADLFAGRRLPYGNMPAVAGEVTLYRPTLPTLFEETRRQLDLPLESVRFFANAPLLQDLTTSLYPQTGGGEDVFELVAHNENQTGEDAEVFSALRSYIQKNHPRFLAANLHKADWDGHYAAEEDAYAKDVQLLDQEIASFYQWLQKEEPDYFSKTVWVVTTDHGRHLGSGEEFREHGDSCRGCRSLPLFVVGPGIPKQELDESMLIQEDLSHLMAGWLGVELPYGVGLPVTTLGEEQPSRQGDSFVSSASRHVASQRWLSDPLHRSAIAYDGESVSDSEVFAAESPAVAESENYTYLCWRELRMDPGEAPDAASWPWKPVCMGRRHGESVWFSLQLAVGEVSSIWRPVIVTQGDQLLMAGINNADGMTTSATDVYVVAYDPAAASWSLWAQYKGFFPSRVAMAVADGTPWLAAGENRADTDMRLNRQIAVMHVGFPDVKFLDPSPVLGSEVQRIENPAIRVDGMEVEVAAVGFAEDGTHILCWKSEDGGQSWGPALDRSSPFPPFAHLSPRWNGDRPVWAVLDDDGYVQFCSLNANAETACVATTASRLDSFAVDNGEVVASLDRGSGDWQVEKILLSF